MRMMQSTCARSASLPNSAMPQQGVSVMRARRSCSALRRKWPYFKRVRTVSSRLCASLSRALGAVPSVPCFFCLDPRCKPRKSRGSNERCRRGRRGDVDCWWQRQNKSWWKLCARSLTCARLRTENVRDTRRCLLGQHGAALCGCVVLLWCAAPLCCAAAVSAAGAGGAAERMRGAHSGLKDGWAALQVLGERDGLVKQLQATVASLEAAALAPNVPDAGKEQLRAQRDEAYEQLEQVRAEHQEAIKAIKGQIDRTNAEHQLLDHDRQRVIEQLKAKVLALEAQAQQLRQQPQLPAEGQSPPHVHSTQGSRSRVLPPPPSPPVHGEGAGGEHLESPPPSSSSQGHGAHGEEEMQVAREMVHVLRSELNQTRFVPAPAFVCMLHVCMHACVCVYARRYKHIEVYVARACGARRLAL